MSPSQPEIPPDIAQLQSNFLQFLPTIESKARSAFEHVSNWHDQEDAVANVIAAAWSYYQSMADQHTDSSSQVSTNVIGAVSERSHSEPFIGTDLESKPISGETEAMPPAPVFPDQWEEIMLPPSMRFHGAGQS